MSFVVAIGLLVCLTAAHATELSDAKFHCITFNPATNVGVFRSNMPITPDTKDSIFSPSSYAYLDILELAGEKGLSECNTTSFSSSDAEPYILEISLSNSADDKNGLLNSISEEGYANLFSTSSGEPTRPIIVLVHCNAGCDRTGEMIGSFRLANDPSLSPSEMYALDVDECGRPPNAYSTHALEWFCIYNFYSNPASNYEVEDCTAFAKCEPFGDCTPV
ncbi:hypothetical protein TrRE_jg6227 [Triparma retinervis]|uniref:Tyrosine specific protein phosphatases domain-containing protein n=1 Tax=Triparma retinervis TaxID=2557542 RepID=A0A9W7L5X9_9STRA|nr:hypothetical protein TrRE_jg6227 [Triparma retinervis]